MNEKKTVMKSLTKCLIIGIIVFIAIVLLMINYSNSTHPKPIIDGAVTVEEEVDWVIDFSIYGIKLGDNIKNLPEGYELVKFWEETNILEYNSPFDEIEQTLISTDDAQNITKLSFIFVEPTTDTFLEVYNTFKQNLITCFPEEYSNDSHILRAKHLSKDTESMTGNYDIDNRAVAFVIKNIISPNTDKVSITFFHAELIEFTGKKLLELNEKE